MTGERGTWATVLDIWLRLIRKDGWADRDAVLERISRLRNAQADFEKAYLDSRKPLQAKTMALELIGLYHLAKAAEIFAHYITDGVVDGKYQIRQLLDTHFDRVLAACKQTQMIDLEPLSRILAASALQMAENSIWTVTRAVNSRVTQFVRNLVDRGRGNRAIFDVLPPTSRIGRTRSLGFKPSRSCCEFTHIKRQDAYCGIPNATGIKSVRSRTRLGGILSPNTRTLVNQITRQFRRDLEPLNIIVEQVSPALEIDNVLRPNYSINTTKKMNFAF